MRSTKNATKKFTKKNFTIYKRNKSFVRPNPATPIINRLSGQVQQLQQMVAQLESEKRMLERMMVLKVEPMDMEDSTAELPGIKGGGEHWPVDFEVAFGMERMSLNC
ncbi:hypothetical protein niasHT_022785 [Heterodera trifolii]|uniref:Uncharacterized protein n=1 Tax=Heterodera trifolii TaxID=157864 RepID=A0ABD2ICJ9_9BILA